VRLINAAPPYPFETGGGRLLRGALGPAGTAGFITLAISLVLAAPVARRRAGAWAEGVGGQVAERPFRASVSLLLLPLLLLQASQAVGGEIVVAPKVQNTAQGPEQRFYYHANHLGSVNVVTDDRGAVTSRRDYKPYGELFAWTGARSGPRELLQAFDGQRIDDRTGLYGFGVRQYDPEIGRFLTADTEVPDPMDPRTLNRYAFAGGNPIRYVDPTGHGFWDWVLGILVIIVAIVIAVVSLGTLSLLSGFALALVLTIGLASLGAAGFGIWALANGISPLSADFWKAVGTGFLLGAIIGAGLSSMWALSFGGIGAATGLIGAIKGMLLSGLVGAMFGAIEAAVVHFKNGGGPEGLLVPLLISAGIGAAISMVTFGIFKGWSAGWVNKVALFLRKFIIPPAAVLFNVAKVVHAGFTGMTVGESFAGGVQVFAGQLLLSLMYYSASPRKGTGVPAWAFSGTMVGGGGGREREGLGQLLQTMPFAL
jgi:RHS repeat-associated protein